MEKWSCLSFEWDRLNCKWKNTKRFLLKLKWIWRKVDWCLAVLLTFFLRMRCKKTYLKYRISQESIQKLFSFLELTFSRKLQVKESKIYLLNLKSNLFIPTVPIYHFHLNWDEITKGWLILSADPVNRLF